MGLRAFNDKTTLDDARESTEHTFEALESHRTKDVRDLAKSLGAHLDSLTKIEQSVRTARRATVRASARVRMRDGDADDAVREFARDVLAEVRQDREAPVYQALFASTPTEIVALTLAPEVEEIDHFIATLADKTMPTELRKKWVPMWKDIATGCREALAEREAAARATTSASLEARRWIERADRLRRAIDGSLTTFAADNNLSSDFNERFYPNQPTTSKSRKAAPAPAAERAPVAAEAK